MKNKTNIYIYFLIMVFFSKNILYAQNIEAKHLNGYWEFVEILLIDTNEVISQKDLFEFSGIEFTYVFNNNELIHLKNGEIYKKYNYKCINNFLMLTIIEIYSESNDSIGDEGVWEFWFLDNYLFIKEEKGDIVKFRRK